MELEPGWATRPRPCVCGCGMSLHGMSTNAKYATLACRVRASKARAQERQRVAAERTRAGQERKPRTPRAGLYTWWRDVEQAEAVARALRHHGLTDASERVTRAVARKRAQ